MKIAKWLLTLLCLLALTCGGERPPLNVLIIAVDTLRSDHLGCYGYGRDTSPAIDRLAEKSTLFEAAISQSPWTLPSFASVFTSLYPSQHGAMSAVSGVRETFPTLAAILSERGYATGAIVNASVLRPEYGLDRGFEYYDPAPAKGRLADGTTRDALAWLDENRGGPFFLFAHYFDPHEPYAPPQPYCTRYRGDYSGPIGNSFVLHDHFPGVRGMDFDDLRELSEADWDQIRALYDGEIAFTDKHIALLLEGLDERGLRENTLIVFLSDHGEEFYEHHGFGHGHTLYREVIHVPLLCSLPGKIPEAKRVEQQVRLIDIMPTILDLLGIEIPNHMEGISLAPMLGRSVGSPPPEKSVLPADAAYSEGMLHGPERKSISTGRWKMIYDLASLQAVLFDRDEDPQESHDLAAERPDALRPLQSLMVKTLLRTSPAWFVEIASAGEAVDLSIRTDTGLGAGQVQLAVCLDESGSPDSDRQGLEADSRSIRISKRAQPERSLTVAALLQGPPRLPVEFSVMIDGEDAAGRTFIGDGLENPPGMPFTLELRGLDARSRGVPRPRPPEPYVLIWRSAPEFQGRKAVQLNESTRQELKSLGYIQ